jgi:hypothetical protein
VTPNGTVLFVLVFNWPTATTWFGAVVVIVE